jgi:hypothetical protein
MDTYFTTNGNDVIKLPDTLWTYFVKSLDYLVAFVYKKNLVNNEQFWINIPNEEREWVSIENLRKSIFIKQKCLIGLDFDDKNPIISNGKYWLLKIEEAISIFNDVNTPTESRNIYIFDNKLNILVCYLYESNSILIWGKNKNLILGNG